MKALPSRVGDAVWKDLGFKKDPFWLVAQIFTACMVVWIWFWILGHGFLGFLLAGILFYLTIFSLRILNSRIPSTYMNGKVVDLKKKFLQGLGICLVLPLVLLIITSPGTVFPPDLLTVCLGLFMLLFLIDLAVLTDVFKVEDYMKCPLCGYIAREGMGEVDWHLEKVHFPGKLYRVIYLSATREDRTRWCMFKHWVRRNTCTEIDPNYVRIEAAWEVEN